MDFKKENKKKIINFVLLIFLKESRSFFKKARGKLGKKSEFLLQYQKTSGKKIHTWYIFSRLKKKAKPEKK